MITNGPIVTTTCTFTLIPLHHTRGHDPAVPLGGPAAPGAESVVCGRARARRAASGCGRGRPRPGASTPADARRTTNGNEARIRPEPPGAGSRLLPSRGRRPPGGSRGHRPAAGPLGAGRPGDDVAGLVALGTVEPNRPADTARSASATGAHAAARSMPGGEVARRRRASAGTEGDTLHGRRPRGTARGRRPRGRAHGRLASSRPAGLHEPAVRGGSAPRIARAGRVPSGPGAERRLASTPRSFNDKLGRKRAITCKNPL